METASSSAPAAPCHNFSLAQAVVALSADAVLAWLCAVIKPSSAAAASPLSSARRPRQTAAPAPAPEKAAPAAAGIDMELVLGLMGAGGGPGAAASVGFDEAAALFEEEEATLEEARAAFAVFDRDGDGFIGAAELGSVLGSLGFQAGAAAAECQRMIDAYDEDKDGRIDFREFLKLMERGQ
ncbi:hypothetical protein ACP4OV_024030 [Aristida adscensionis]